jgi:hypothetical protein
MKRPKTLSFQSKLERISSEANYFALSVPLKISQALGTKGPVPVLAKLNNAEPFLVSLFPVGGGRHYIRVKAKVRDEAKIKAGDRVRVKITVRNHADEVSIPKDLEKALRSERVLDDFKSLSNGKKSFMLRLIEEAARAQTRAKRIRDAVEAAHEKREKNLSG